MTAIEQFASTVALALARLKRRHTIAFTLVAIPVALSLLISAPLALPSIAAFVWWRSKNSTRASVELAKRERLNATIDLLASPASITKNFLLGHEAGNLALPHTFGFIKNYRSSRDVGIPETLTVHSISEDDQLATVSYPGDVLNAGEQRGTIGLMQLGEVLSAYGYEPGDITFRLIEEIDRTPPPPVRSSSQGHEDADGEYPKYPEYSEL